MNIKKQIIGALPVFIKDMLKIFFVKNYAKKRKISNLAKYLPKITCIDIGASYFPHEKWFLFLNSKNTQWIAIEPNKENLFYIKCWKFLAKVRVVTSGISNEGGKQALYITNVDSGSSLLPPIVSDGMRHRVNQKSMQYFFPLKKVLIDTITLKEVIECSDVKTPIIIKLDTQGTELSILKSIDTYLDAANVVGVEMESTLLASPIMQGSGKFWQAFKYMEEKGFELLDINIIRASFNGKVNGKGYLNECDAVFCLRRDVALKLPVEYRICLLSFYLCYFLFEEAITLLDNDKGIRVYFEKKGLNVDQFNNELFNLI